MVLRRSSGPRPVSSPLTDFMPLHPDDTHNDIGRHSPAGDRPRSSRASTGTVELDVEIAIRPEYGLTTPLVVESEPGIWHTRGGPVRASVATDVDLEADARRAAGTIHAARR